MKIGKTIFKNLDAKYILEKAIAIDSKSNSKIVETLLSLKEVFFKILTSFHSEVFFKT